MSVKNDISSSSGNDFGYLVASFSCSIPSFEHVTRKSCVIKGDIVGYNIRCRITCRRSTIGYILNSVGNRSPLCVKSNISIASLRNGKVCRYCTFFIGKPTIEGISLFSERIDCEVLTRCVVMGGVVICCTIHIVIGDIILFKTKLCVYRDISACAFSYTCHLRTSTNIFLCEPTVEGVSYGLTDKSCKLELIFYCVSCLYCCSLCVVTNRVVVKEYDCVFNCFPFSVKFNCSGCAYRNLGNLSSKVCIAVPAKEDVMSLVCINESERLIFYIISCRVVIRRT